MCEKMSLLVMLILVLAGCASAETRAGAWDASTEYGDFTIYVSEDGTTVTQVDYDFECEDLKMSVNNMPFREPAERIKGRKLSMSVISMFIEMVSFEATFSSDGKRLAGTVAFVPQSITGGCKADFTSTR